LVSHQRQNNFSLHSVQTGFGTYEASFQVSIEAFFSDVKVPEREAEHSPPSSVEVKNCGGIYLYSPMRLHGVVFN
jgi:hypothetical protein